MNKEQIRTELSKLVLGIKKRGAIAVAPPDDYLEMLETDLIPRFPFDQICGAARRIVDTTVNFYNSYPALGAWIAAMPGKVSSAIADGSRKSNFMSSVELLIDYDPEYFVLKDREKDILEKGGIRGQNAIMYIGYDFARLRGDGRANDFDRSRILRDLDKAWDLVDDTPMDKHLQVANDMQDKQSPKLTILTNINKGV